MSQPDEHALTNNEALSPQSSETGVVAVRGDDQVVDSHVSSSVAEHSSPAKSTDDKHVSLLIDTCYKKWAYINSADQNKSFIREFHSEPNFLMLLVSCTRTQLYTSSCFHFCICPSSSSLHLVQLCVFFMLFTVLRLPSLEKTCPPYHQNCGRSMALQPSG